MNLAKHPASTVQILGAEKALFRALKTKHDTPKYGLIYHASLIGQAAPKNKGKISRVLAAKTALSIRVDALGDKDTAEIGSENRAKVEERLRQLEGRQRTSLSGSGKGKAATPKYKAPATPVPTYNPGADSTLPSAKKSEKKKPHTEELDTAEVEAPGTCGSRQCGSGWVGGQSWAQKGARTKTQRCIFRVRVCDLPVQRGVSGKICGRAHQRGPECFWFSFGTDRFAT